MISANLAQRIAVAAVAIPAILFLVFWGGDIFLYFILLLTALGLFEYLNGGGIKPYSIFFLIPFVGVLAAVYLKATGVGQFGELSLLGIFLIVGVLLSIGAEPAGLLFSRLIYIIFGSFYLGLLYPYVFLIRGQSDWLSIAPATLVAACWIWVATLLE